MAERLTLIGQDASEEDIYTFVSMLCGKIKSLSNDLEGLEKKKAKDIELGLKVLRNYFKSRA